MCGRFFIGQPPEVYRALYGYSEQPNFPGRFNVAPTQPVPVVMRESGERHFRLMRWGLWPAWLKDPSDFPTLFNARIETAAEKPAFRGALRHRRCVFLADGFYEWRRDGAGKAATKTPFAVRRTDGAPMAFAGLWEPWMGADGSEVDTAAIITCSANGTLSAIHERMPAILAPESVGPWLDAAVRARSRPPLPALPGRMAAARSGERAGQQRAQRRCRAARTGGHARRPQGSGEGRDRARRAVLTRSPLRLPRRFPRPSPLRTVRRRSRRD